MSTAHHLQAATQKRRDELERKLNMPPKTQEEMNSKFRLWEIQGISREEQDRLALNLSGKRFDASVMVLEVAVHS